MLKGWEVSSGAFLELGTAKRFGLKLMIEDNSPDGFTIYDDWNIIVSLLTSSIKGN